MRTANNYFQSGVEKFITTAKETLKRLDGEICAFLALHEVSFFLLDNKGEKNAEIYFLSRTFKGKCGWYIRNLLGRNETELVSQYLEYQTERKYGSHN